MQKLIYVPLENQKPCSVLIVGEAPGEQEEKYGRPFVGRSGSFLRTTLQENGFDLSDVAITNVVKVRPENNRIPTEEEIYSWLPSLWADILDTQPVAIIACGKTAHRAIRLLSDRLDPTSLHFIHHPSYILRLRNPIKEQAWKDQISQIASWYSTLKQSNSDQTEQR